uniref:Uncharacterized protein n=1 Tax=Picea glauca TaxID=3330 RepID=A0A101LZX0_PICGL|nr:hypothetical protein ABT39_MTgene4481 [Picea glauca]QHR87430.1 hypothetical protein Q903MT_gene1440 [Picea sitchensis]
MPLMNETGRMKIGRNRLTELIMGCAIMISLVSNISFVRAEGACHKSCYLRRVTSIVLLRTEATVRPKPEGSSIAGGKDDNCILYLWAS